MANPSTTQPDIPELIDVSDCTIRRVYAVQFPNGFILPVGNYMAVLTYLSGSGEKDLHVVWHDEYATPWRVLDKKASGTPHGTTSR